jgi:hypothetical protein
MTPLESYIQQVQELPRPEAGWFASSLAAYRKGRADDDRRELCGRFLNHTLAEAAEYCRWHSATDVFDAIQEANTALVNAVNSFEHNSLAEFEAYLHRQVQMRLYSVVPPTGMA